MKQIRFFALKDDLLALLELVESKGPLKYVRTGNFLAEEVTNGLCMFATGRDLPNLGKATSDHTAGCESFLVCEPKIPVLVRRFRANDGRERVCVDQLLNPESVVFTPAGMWSEDVVLNGSVDTASDSPISQSLIKLFQATVKKSFTKVKAFYVGQRALTLLENGKRLAGAVQSPRDFDLTLAR